MLCLLGSTSAVTVVTTGTTVAVSVLPSPRLIVWTRTYAQSVDKKSLRSQEAMQIPPQSRFRNGIGLNFAALSPAFRLTEILGNIFSELLSTWKTRSRIKWHKCCSDIFSTLVLLCVQSWKWDTTPNFGEPSLRDLVGWTWWDWILILRIFLPSVLWHCWLGHLVCKNPSPIWPIMCLVGR